MKYIFLSFLILSGNLFCMEEVEDWVERLKKPDELAKFIEDENYVTSLGLPPAMQEQVARELLLRRVPISKKQEVTEPEHIMFNAVNWSHDSVLVALGQYKKTIYIRNITTGSVQKLEGYGDQVYTVAWSFDGKRLASGAKDGTIRIWNTQTGECVHKLQGPECWVYSVSWSYDGAWLASGSDDGTVCIWNAQTGKCVHTLPAHKSFFCSVSWSPNGTVLASCSHETVYLWDATNGQRLHTLEGDNNIVCSVHWSPDGNRLASCSRETVYLWDVHTGQCVQVLRGHKDTVSSVSWSPDGAWLASASADNTVRIWDTVTGKCVRVLKDHNHWVYSVSWSPDGNSLVTISYDKRLFLFNVKKFLQVARESKSIDLEQALLIEYVENTTNSRLEVNRSEYFMSIVHSIPKTIKPCFPALVLLSGFLNCATSDILNSIANNNTITTTTNT